MTEDETLKLSLIVKLKSSCYFVSKFKFFGRVNNSAWMRSFKIFENFKDIKTQIRKKRIIFIHIKLFSLTDNSIYEIEFRRPITKPDLQAVSQSIGGSVKKIAERHL